HRAEAKPPASMPAMGDAMGKAQVPAALDVPPDAADKPARKVWKNLQVLGGRPAPALRGAMIAFTLTLGVTCGHCHDEKDWASDAVPAKRRAREMIRMVTRTSAELSGIGGVSCWMCHRGQAIPPLRP